MNENQEYSNHKRGFVVKNCRVIETTASVQSITEKIILIDQFSSEWMRDDP